MLPTAPFTPRSTRTLTAAATIAAGILCVCLSAGESFAQSDADRATARALAAEGFQALQRDDYETAEDRFRRADALVHAPTLVVDRGRALIGMGRYVEAQEQFELVLREGVPNDAPASWRTALQDARGLLEEVKPKVAWLTISVPEVSNAEISVDGNPIPRAAQGVARATNPGTRTVEVSADGYRARRLTVELSEGGEQTLEVRLDALPRSQRKPSADAGTTPVADRQADWVQPVTYAALGVGGAGLLVGSVTGLLTLKKHSDLADVCPDGFCPPEQESAISSYHRLGWVSGVGFAVGVAGAATGVVLWTWERAQTAPEQSGRPRVDLYVAPQAAGLRGSF